jgi:hypothetical protein
MAALTVFAIITVGITPLLASSLRGSALSRSGTVGKDAALQAMERLRGLPFYVAFQAQAGKVDLLDMYFPCADPALSAANGCTGEGTRTYTAATGMFTLTCASGVTGPSCAIPLPAGYSLRYEMRFVRGDGTTPEPPLSTYKRNPGATEAALDTPPSQLVDASVVALWNFGGDVQTYTLRSLLGDRKFGPIKVAGLARVAYGVQTQTSFQHTTGDTEFSDLTGLAGSTESRVQTRLVSTARQSVRGAEISLIRRPQDASEEAVHLGVSPLRAIVTDISAPPNQAPAPVSSPGAEVVLDHPNLLSNDEVAKMFTVATSGVDTNVTSGLPNAAGGFVFQPSNTTGYFWMNNQTDILQNELLKLDLSKKVFSLKSQGTTSTTMSGDSNITTTALGVGRQVLGTADLFIDLLRAMPVTFLSGTEDERHALIIKDFTAAVDCKAAGDTTNSTVTASWSATFKMWRDSNNNGTTGLGGSEIVASNVAIVATPTTLTVNGTPVTATTSMKTILLGLGVPEGNPLIYDGLSPAQDVYLFKDAVKNGYLEDFTISMPTVSEELDGDLTRAGIDGAMNITTVPTNPLLPESGINIAVGSLSCETLDQR